MLNKEVKRIVSDSISTHAKGDSVSKSELEEILIDVLTSFGQSSALSDAVEKRVSDKLQSTLRARGIR